jgi:lysophospholipase L1-like esterase
VLTYGWYLRKYIADVKARIITIVVLSSIKHPPESEVMAGDVEKSNDVTLADEVATTEKVPFVNLNKLVMARYAGPKPAEIKSKYFTESDGTHTSSAGGRIERPLHGGRTS